MQEQGTIDDWLSELIGEQLSSVEFVQDYFQLRFGGPTITVLNPTTVSSGQHLARSWDENFRNLLCGQIAKQISRASFADHVALTIEFEDGAHIAVSLLDNDYTGPEALNLSGFSRGFMMVV